MKLDEILQDNSFIRGVVLTFPYEEAEYNKSYFDGIFGFRKEHQAQEFREKLQDYYGTDEEKIIEIHKCEIGTLIPAWIVCVLDGLTTDEDIHYFVVGSSKEEIEEEFEDEITSYMYKNKILEEKKTYLELDTSFDFDKPHTMDSDGLNARIESVAKDAIWDMDRWFNGDQEEYAALPTDHDRADYISQDIDTYFQSLPTMERKWADDHQPDIVTAIVNELNKRL